MPPMCIWKLTAEELPLKLNVLVAVFAAMMQRKFASQTKLWHARAFARTITNTCTKKMAQSVSVRMMDSPWHAMTLNVSFAMQTGQYVW